MLGSISTRILRVKSAVGAQVIISAGYAVCCRKLQSINDSVFRLNEL